VDNSYRSVGVIIVICRMSPCHGKAAKQNGCDGKILYGWCPYSILHLPAKNYKCSFKFAKIIVKNLLASFLWTMYFWNARVTAFHSHFCFLLTAISTICCPLSNLYFFVTGDSGGYWQKPRRQDKFGWIYKYVLFFYAVVNVLFLKNFWD